MAIIAHPAVSVRLAQRSQFFVPHRLTLMRRINRDGGLMAVFASVG